MPTNALRPGMCNLAVNMTIDERRVLGRIAFQEDRSTSGFVRRMILRGLEVEYPQLAAEIKSVREKHRLAARIVGVKAGNAVSILLVGAAMWLSATGQIDEQVRRPVSARIVRSARRMEDA